MATVARIKYIEDAPSQDDDVESSGATAVDKEMLVNVNCPIRMLLGYVREVARLSDTCEFDLCDEMNCQLKNVSFYEPCARATDVLQPNSTYFIVTFQRDENGQMINLTPLLTAKAAKRYCDVVTKTQRPSRGGSSNKSALKKSNSSSKSNESAQGAERS